MEAPVLSHKVSVTACTAKRVGERVRTLDEEMCRVHEASDCIHQVMSSRFTLFAFFIFFPLKHVLIRFPHVLVIVVLSSVINRRARLGIHDTTLFKGHGSP